MSLFLDHDEQVNGQESCNHSNDIKQVFSRQNYTKVAYLLGYNFVLERVQAKQACLFHIVEALCAFVNCLFGQSHKEGHQKKTQHTENQNAEDCNQVAEQVGFVGDDRV
jgi:hypothetical protein